MKKNFLKAISAILLVSMMSIVLAGCGSSTKSSTSASGLEGLKEKGKIVVGTMAATPPYEYHSIKGGEDKIVGSDIKLLDEVAKDLGVEYEIKDMDFDGLLVALQSGKIDMIVSAMSPTEEREKNADFTDVYYKGRNVMLVRKEDLTKYKTADSLADKKIAAIKTSVQQSILESELPKAELKLLGKSTELSLDLANKKVEAVLVDIPTATLLEKGNPSIAASEIYYEDPSAGAAIAMPNGTDKEIMDAINSTIERIKPDYEKWLKDAMDGVELED
ncbi:transporter substrate-binding domain-containing protein [Niallia sp. NCCP-28]|uniref:transporter substrate-binding domain-containing protein n=1 Tax=Niallia sp. NCCP-28 TaxID=2934712 RepID=UPI00207F5879|nr:transporter substrate-binding domain-containing protein [Niallia sp. NCCP-28]GKU83478.1 amino acid ABC transporter [Niallia sp. NCCP-28]